MWRSSDYLWFVGDSKLPQGVNGVCVSYAVLLANTFCVIVCVFPRTPQPSVRPPPGDTKAFQAFQHILGLPWGVIPTVHALKHLPQRHPRHLRSRNPATLQGPRSLGSGRGTTPSSQRDKTVNYTFFTPVLPIIPHLYCGFSFYS